MRRTAKVALVLLLAPHASFLQSAAACSRAYRSIKVRTSFVVVVHDPDGNPLPHMEVKASELIRKSGDVSAHVEIAAVAVTSKDGKAAMGLVQDDYSLGATANGISSEVTYIQVYDDGSGVSEVNLTWPGGPITAVQGVSGVFGPGLQISLKSASSDIGTAATDRSGHFAFRGVSPGFYALHVSDPRPSAGYSSKLEGNIPIHVNPDATNRELPHWELVMSSCGLSANTTSSIIVFSP